ncbi:hypothetical protein ACXET9_06080 [Brachybacterium sp. DNPG3]
MSRHRTSAARAVGIALLGALGGLLAALVLQDALATLLVASTGGPSAAGAVLGGSSRILLLGCPIVGAVLAWRIDRRRRRTHRHGEPPVH